jgi:hypothetical protein
VRVHPRSETIPEAENQALAESRYNDLLNKKFWNFLKDKKHLLIRRAAYQLLATISHKARRTSPASYACACLHVRALLS